MDVFGRCTWQRVNKKWMLDFMCNPVNQILWYLPCLQAPLTLREVAVGNFFPEKICVGLFLHKHEPISFKVGRVIDTADL